MENSQTARGQDFRRGTPTKDASDADQGVRGLPPGAEKRKPSKDAFLMEITDLGRHGPGGLVDEDYYTEACGLLTDERRVLTVGLVANDPTLNPPSVESLQRLASGGFVLLLAGHVAAGQPAVHTASTRRTEDGS